MGMFDDDLVPFKDHFEEGVLFTLQDAKVGKHEIPTEFGPGIPVMLKVNDKWYSSFGDALINQVERMEAGELPTKVAMIRRKTKDGKREMKLLVTEQQLEKVRDGEEVPF